MAPIQSALHPAGPEAAHLSHLWWIFFWSCATVYLLLIAFLVAAWLRGRRNAEPDVTADTEKRRTTAIGAATVLSIAGLLALIVVSVVLGHTVGTFGTAQSNRLEIEVTGHQWWWEVKYAEDPIVTANEMHIPVGTPVLLRLDTRDVIHSLWIPNLHGKRDLIPGRVNRFIIQADRPGVYRGQCAEFCGLQHAHMALVVIAEEPEKFAEWKARAVEGAPAPLTPQQARGQHVFLSGPCAKCHNIGAATGASLVGPDLTHFRSRPTLAAGMLQNNRGNLAGWISNAPAIKPGVQMPASRISGEQLQDLLAYLDTLK